MVISNNQQLLYVTCISLAIPRVSTSYGRCTYSYISKKVTIEWLILTRRVPSVWRFSDKDVTYQGLLGPPLPAVALLDLATSSPPSTSHDCCSPGESRRHGWFCWTKCIATVKDVTACRVLRMHRDHCPVNGLGISHDNCMKHMRDTCVCPYLYLDCECGTCKRG